MSNKFSFLLVALLLAGMYAFGQSSGKPYHSNQPRTLIIFFDGLRPDYITATDMPRLYAFKQQACYGDQHHSVIPTVTRVNASSYSSGSYPGTHGLMGNTVYFPMVDPKKGLNTGDAEELNKINAATHGHLLTATTLGEIVGEAGEKMLVFSSGSTGQAMMQNHTISGGAIINPAMILPDSISERVIREVGPLPAGTKPYAPKHKWITDALVRYGLIKDGPLVSAIWFSDPDGTAHSDGIGSPTAMRSILSVDEQFGRIIDTIHARGLDDFFNIIISTDHGFVTNIGKKGLAEFLIEKGIKKDKESEDVVVAEGAIYVQGHDADKIKQIITLLQAEEWVGGIFTRGKQKGDMKGIVEGTLSFESIHWDHPERSADILVDENWDDRKNSAGYAGTSFSRGVAGHGGMSPYEIHIPLILSGPAFKRASISGIPTSNVDIVPTVLYLHGMKIPGSMDGRPMLENLVKKSENADMKFKTEDISTSVTTDWGKYEIHINRSVAGKYSYVNYVKVIREKN